MKIPMGLYGDGHDGLQDPERITAAERTERSEGRLVEERRRRSSWSDAVRRLQRATDQALGRRVG